MKGNIFITYSICLHNKITKYKCNSPYYRLSNKSSDKDRLLAAPVGFVTRLHDFSLVWLQDKGQMSQISSQNNILFFP